MPQLQEELFLDALFLRQQIVQRLVPELQLVEADLHAARWFPDRRPATAGTRAEVVIFQPLRQGVLAARVCEAVGHQGKHAFRQRLAVPQLGPAGIQDRVQGQLLKQVRATRMGPQVEAHGAVTSPADTQRGEAASAWSRRTRASRWAASRSLRPRWATILCFTLSPSRKDSTRRRYSCRPLGALTERRNTECHL